MFDSIRLRLAFWHFIIFASLQAVLGVGVYFYITSSLAGEMDSILTHVLQSGAMAIQQPASHDASGYLDAPRALRTVHHIETPIVIYNAAGEVLAERPETVSQLTPLLARPSAMFFATTPAHPELNRGDRRYAVQRVHDRLSGQDFYVAASISLSTYEDVLRTARHAFLIGTPFMLLLTILGGWRLTGRSLEPAVSMAERARSIGAEDMHERLIAQKPGNEFGRLAAALNDLLDRLAAKSLSQRQFMADAAHEIRTPLSVIQTAVNVSLLNPESSVEELHETMVVVETYVQRLTRSVNDVFRLARSDAGFVGINIQSLYLDEVLSNVVRAARLLALAKSLSIELEPMEAAPMRGDDSLLHDLFLNLLENSIKYTPRDGAIRVGLVPQGDGYNITVADTGVGIAFSDRERIFQRFYRGTPAHDRPPSADEGREEQTEGTGLGLAIARWIATSHQGTLDLQSSDENGSTFLVHLPSAPAQS